MKVKVVKDYIGKSGILHKVGETDEWIGNLGRHRESLLKNGFVEKIEEDEGWQPKCGENYYLIGVDGKIECFIWTDHSLDKALLARRNIYKTREEAEKFKKWLDAVKVLEADTKGYKACKNNGLFWSVDIDIYCGGLRIDGWYANMPCAYTGGCFNFATMEDASRSISKHRKEWLIFFGVEDEE